MKVSRISVALLLTLIAVDGMAAPHRSEWEAWRARRLESLRREDGWLTLVGLFWLEAGENSFGSDPGNRIVLPSGKAPARMGSIFLRNGSATLQTAAGAGLIADGKEITSGPLVTDAGGAKPTVVKHGSLSFYLIQRGSRLGVRVKDSKAATAPKFSGNRNLSL